MRASSDPRRPRPLWWAALRALAFFALLALCACAADDAGSADGPSDQGGVDPEPEPPPDCVLVSDGLCLDDADDRCPLTRRLVRDEGCEDLDEDCFVAGCDADPALLDCDDRAPDINPLAAERCDGVDHDCDGDPQNGYPLIGEGCAICGRGGKLECAVDDPTRLTCSVYAGQSDALDPLPDELCDGVDDDCDGRIDEQCRVDAPPGARLEMPAVCPDGALVVIEDGALKRYGPVGPSRPVEETLRGPEARPMHPHCGPAGIAWLEVTGEQPCVDAPGGPLTCLATLWYRPDGGQAAAIVALADDIGPPLVTDEAVFWHRVVRDTPSLLRWDFADPPRLAVDGALSDPTPPGVDGAMAVREWLEGEARVARVDLADGSTFEIIDASAGQENAGPPTAARDRIAWSGGGAEPVLWVVDFRGGFRPVARPGPQRAPRLAGDALVWLDEGDGISLRRFDLLTGDERPIAEADIAVDGFDARIEEVVWVERDPAGDRLRRQAMPGFEPEPIPEPDWGADIPPPDMGPELDMGPAPDMGSAPDAGLSSDAG